MPPPSVIIQRNKYWLFLACLALGVIVLGAVATSRYGAGVASDSVKYMAVAQNLLDGNGLYDHRGLPLLSWPPLFSAFLAMLSGASGLDVFVVGWYVNLLLLGVNLYLSGVILWRVFQTQPFYAYLGSAFIFFSISSLRMHATMISDALYLTMTLLLLIVADDYIKHGSRRAFWGMVLLSALAPMQRYVGLAVSVTGLIVIFVEHRRNWRVLFRDGFILGLASVLPIFWWLVIHNILTYGTLWGTSNDRAVDVIQNISLALTKMLHWFVPYLSALMPILLRPFIVLGVIALILLLLNVRKRENLFIWGRAFTQPAAYPSMVYGFVYFFAVALTIITSDHRYLPSDRYYVILLVQTMIVLFVTFETLIRPHLKFSERQIALGLTAFFVLWSVYPIYGLREYLTLALERGEPSDYNLFNTRRFHEMPVVAEMQRMRAEQPGLTFYSNYVDAVWFYTRQPVRVLPHRDVPDLDAAYTGWPHSEAGYIVWFKPNEYKHYLSPKELQMYGDLQLIYADESGDIYFVSPK